MYIRLFLCVLVQQNFILFILGKLLLLFSCSFFLTKKNQKVKAKDQLQSFSPSKSLRNTAEKIVARSLSPKAAALLPTYDKYAIQFFLNPLRITHKILGYLLTQHFNIELI